MLHALYLRCNLYCSRCRESGFIISNLVVYRRYFLSNASNSNYVLFLVGDISLLAFRLFTNYFIALRFYVTVLYHNFEIIRAPKTFLRF